MMVNLVLCIRKNLHFCTSEAFKHLMQFKTKVGFADKHYDPTNSIYVYLGFTKV